MIKESINGKNELGQECKMRKVAVKRVRAKNRPAAKFTCFRLLIDSLEVTPDPHACLVWDAGLLMMGCTCVYGGLMTFYTYD